MHTSIEIENSNTSIPLSPDAIWNEASEELRSAIKETNFTNWFSSVRAIDVHGASLILEVPHQFAKDWIESRYTEALEQAVARAAHRPLSITLLPRDPAEAPPEPEIISAPVVEPLPTTGPASDAERPSTELDFHPKYNFDSFVIGASNRFAHAAALAVAEVPAQAYNPLFIYGGAGLGKTHLLQAIGSYVKLCHPGMQIRYVSTEQFMNDFIVALRSNSIPRFHSRYRAVDLLLIDDIQFLEGKERTQEEFFHTFNALHPKSQIVITSDRPPKKISTLEERLRTRFEWGLITDIQPPDLETRLAIIQRKADVDNLPVPPDVMEFIATRIQTNIRELEGALIRVAAYASLTHSAVTLELAQDVLRSLLPNSAEARVTPDLVIRVAADYFDLSIEDIKSPNRSRPLVTARQISMYLCRELTDLSLPEIGRRFGGRDHSTVIHAINKILKQLPERSACYEQVQELTARIRQQAARG
ncbi:MAG: chromosomal replication initiator protein DnaA [Actinobacteria bacterium]|nr:chromosomal replication initiator protein DnaA [Actinomycetota bacterium]